MENSITINLIYNITILLTLALIYSTLQNNVKVCNLRCNILLGFCIGIVGLLIMSIGLQLTSEVIFDARTILISVAGMFFGMIPTIIAGTMMIIYRLIIGGSGMYAGIIVIITTTAIGVLWHNYRFQKILERKNKYIGEFYIFGLIIHVDMFLCMLVLPKDQIFVVFKNILLPVFILFPIATYLLCIILFNQYTRNDLIIRLKESEEKYRQIAENFSDVIWTADINLNTTYVSPAVENLIGEPAEVYMNRSLEEKFPLEDINKIKSILLKEPQKVKDSISDEIRTQVIEAKHYHANGTIIWISMQISFIRDEIGNTIGFHGVTKDISEIKKVEEEKARQAGLIISLVDSIPDLIFYKDINGVYLGCNIPFTEFVGKQKNEIIGKTDHDLFNIEIAGLFRYHDNQMLNQKIPRRNEEWVTYPDGRKILLETLKTPYWDVDGVLIGILGISRDITERKQREEVISYIGYHDHLTGLYNRRFYEEELIRLDVKRNLPLTIMLGDVNGLKLINDSFGHTVGDELLKKVAKVIKNGCRADDIIARYGGDEFIILLPKTDASTADEIIKRINELSLIEKINEIDISISFGHETKNNDIDEIHDILKTAEDNMYRHKLFESASIRSKTIDIIMNSLYEKNNIEMLHSVRVSKICEETAIKMNLNSDSVSKIKFAGYVHDIGKIAIDEHILNNPNKLNEDEWNEIKKHPEIGYRILNSSNEFSEIAEYVLEHQEKWDGSGYPKGLKGQEILVEARIIAIADAYDAMTSYRPYREMLSKNEAIDEIKRNSGLQFDPEIVKIFIEDIGY